MPKVLYVIDTLEIGGTERSLLEIAPRLGRWRAEICAIYRGTRLRPAFEAAGIAVHALDLSGRYVLHAARRHLERLIARLNPDLIHSSLFRADLACRLLHRPPVLPLVGSLVNVPYGPAARRLLSRAQRVKLLGQRLVDAWTARRVDLFIANSETAKRENCRDLLIPAEKVRVVPRGRDGERFRPLEASARARVRAALGLASEDLAILCTSRLLARKGQRELLEAFARLGPEYRAKLLLAGEGPMRDELEARSRELGVAARICLLGTRADIPDLLAAADLFAFPSHFEGLPGGLIEAMLAGCPIVASDLPVVAEVVENGRSALFFRCGDPENLAARVLELIRQPDLRRQLGETARASALVRFDLTAIAKRYEAIYDELLESGKARGA